MTPNNVPSDDVLDVMADAMLDPQLRQAGGPPLPSGNVVRKKVLMRAFAAANSLGWHLVKIEPVSS